MGEDILEVRVSFHSLIISTFLPFTIMSSNVSWRGLIAHVRNHRADLSCTDTKVTSCTAKFEPVTADSAPREELAENRSEAWKTSIGENSTLFFQLAWNDVICHCLGNGIRARTKRLHLEMHLAASTVWKEYMRSQHGTPRGFERQEAAGAQPGPSEPRMQDLNDQVPGQEPFRSPARPRAHPAAPTSGPKHTNRATQHMNMDLPYVGPRGAGSRRHSHMQHGPTASNILVTRTSSSLKPGDMDKFNAVRRRRQDRASSELESWPPHVTSPAKGFGRTTGSYRETLHGSLQPHTNHALPSFLARRQTRDLPRFSIPFQSHSLRAEDFSDLFDHRLHKDSKVSAQEIDGASNQPMPSGTLSLAKSGAFDVGETRTKGRSSSLNAKTSNILSASQYNAPWGDRPARFEPGESISDITQAPQKIFSNQDLLSETYSPTERGFEPGFPPSFRYSWSAHHTDSHSAYGERTLTDMNDLASFKPTHDRGLDLARLSQGTKSPPHVPQLLLLTDMVPDEDRRANTTADQGITMSGLEKEMFQVGKMHKWSSTIIMSVHSTRLLVNLVPWDGKLPYLRKIPPSYSL